MKIVKHEFIVRNLAIVDKKEEIAEEHFKCSFALTHTSHRLFEESYGRSLLGSFAVQKENFQSKLFEPRFVLALAAASFYTTEGAIVNQTDATYESFLDSPASLAVTSDIGFMEKLFTMVSESLPQEPKKKAAKSSKKKPRQATSK